MDDLVITVHDVVGDGNCFFRALYKSLDQKGVTEEVFGILPNNNSYRLLDGTKHLPRDKYIISTIRQLIGSIVYGNFYGSHTALLNLIKPYVL
jgi:hypothetical protein